MGREELFQRVFSSERDVRNSVSVEELMKAMSLEEGAWCKTCKIFVPMMQLPIYLLKHLKGAKVPGVNSTGKVQPVCPKCLRKPSAEQDEIRYQDVVEAAQKRMQRGEQNRYLMPTPERYIDATLENFEMRAGVEKAVKGAIYFIENISKKKEKGCFYKVDSDLEKQEFVIRLNTL